MEKIDIKFSKPIMMSIVFSDDLLLIDFLNSYLFYIKEYHNTIILIHDKKVNNHNPFFDGTIIAEFRDKHREEITIFCDDENLKMRRVDTL